MLTGKNWIIEYHELIITTREGGVKACFYFTRTRLLYGTPYNISLKFH